MQRFTYIALFSCIVLLFAATGCSDDEPVSPVNGGSNGDGSLGKSGSSYLVEYGSEKQLQKGVQAVGGVIDDSFSQINVASVSGLTDTDAQVLEGMPGIQSVTRDDAVQWVPTLQQALGFTTQTVSSVTPQSNPANATLFGLQWGLQTINAPAAWTITKGSSEVRVGVLDTGISPDHVDLAGKYDLSKSINLSPSNPGDPSDYQDRHFHGTHVSGTISTNNIGVAGVAPDVTLVGVKVLGDDGSAPFANILAGMMYATDVADCDIINLSLGGYGPRAKWGRFISMVYKAVNYCNANGVLVVMAAGNDGIDLDHNGPFVTLPAEAGAGMAISATGPTFGNDPTGMACYTNYGTSAISIAAPGGNFDCANSSLNAIGDLVISCFAPYIAQQIGAPNPTAMYVWAAGTSMAAPHAAGAAALVETAKGNSNPGYLRARMQNTAMALGAPGADPYYGKGHLDVGAAVQ